MKKFLSTKLLIATFTILFISKASADVTTQDVWNKLRSFITSSEFELTATETQTHGVLKINELFFSRTLPNKNFGQGLQLSLSFSSLRFTQNSDGTVTILLPKQVIINVHSESASDKELFLEVKYTHTKPEITVSGTPDEPVYNYTAEKSQLELGKLKLNGIDLLHFGLFAHADIKKININSAAIKSTPFNFMQTLTIEKVVYFAGMPMKNSSMDLGGEILEFRGSNNMTLPFIKKLESSTSLLTAGANFKTNWEHSGKKFNFSSNETGKDGKIKRQSSGGAGELKLNQEFLKLFLESTETDLSLSHDDLPFPVTLELKKLTTNISFPLDSNMKAKPFSLGVGLSDFTMSEVLWSIFDENSVLPRRPISLIFDTYGKTKILFNDLKSAAWGDLKTKGTFPVEVEKMTLQNFYLSGAGIAVNGHGIFEFGKSDLLKFKGKSLPIGWLEINFQGGNTLIDRLTKINLIPKAQSLGIKMMLSMLTVPGGLDDELKARLEVTKDGHILANGQRIR
ncbi:MAG: hypothetical protein HOM71_10400 [Deltaproteobacteria bacterium]|nr:hypothetical protein [Deltaproteobacteria bacterium]